MLLVIIFNIPILFIIIVYVYFKKCFRYWKQKGVYTASPIIPFGNAANKFLDKVNVGVEFKNLYFHFKRKGFQYGGYYFATTPIFVPVDLELIKNILAKDFEHFTDHLNVTGEKFDALSDHFLSLKDERWEEVRRMLTPNFTSIKIETMFESIIKCAIELEKTLQVTERKNEVVNAKDVVERFIIDIMRFWLSGLNENFLEEPNKTSRNHDHMKFVPKFLKEILHTIGMFFPQSIPFFKIPIHTNEKHDIFLPSLAESAKTHRNSEQHCEDFLKNTRPEDGGDLAMKEHAQQVLVSFLAAYETSSTAIIFLLYELAAKVTIQDKLRKEINDVLSAHDGTLSYDAVEQMKYLDQCVQEILRKYPPIPNVSRICTKNYEVPESNVIIDKGVVVIIPLLGIQHDPEYHPDPFTYDPERFSEENKKNRNPFSCIPFGEGPRMCIGLKLGLIQVKVAIISFLKKFTFTLNSRTSMPLVFNKNGTVLSPKGGVWLDIEKI